MNSEIADHNTSRRAALFVLYLSMFLVVAGVGIITPLFPFFAKEIGADAFQLGLLIAVYSLAQAIAAPLWGRLSDRLGRKPILVAGLIGYAASFFMLIWSPNFHILLLARLIGGFVSASAFPTAQAYLVDLVPDEKRGHAMANMGAASNLGFLLGPTLGGVLAVLGIRAAFAVGGFIILATAGLGAAFLPASNTMEIVSRKPVKQNLSAILTAMFGRDSSLLWVTMLISFGSITMYSILGYYIIDKFNALTTDATIVYTLMGGVSVLLQTLVVGRAIKRYSEDPLLIGSLLLGVIGFVGLVYAPSMAALYYWVAIISISLAMARPVILVALSRRTQLGQGLAMGLQGSFDSFGRVIGPIWAGWIFGSSLSAPYWSAVVVFSLAAAWHFTATRLTQEVPSSYGNPIS